jgi:hypothetical protein
MILPATGYLRSSASSLERVLHWLDFKPMRARSTMAVGAGSGSGSGVSAYFTRESHFNDSIVPSKLQQPHVVSHGYLPT